MPTANAEGFGTKVDLFGIARPPRAQSLPLIPRNVGTSAGSSAGKLHYFPGRVEGSNVS